MDRFLGREKEVAELEATFHARSASLVVLTGRRRIGKSRLVAEFARSYPFYSFMGLAPRPGMVAQDQRNEFLRQLQEYFAIPGAKAEDWGDLFTLLAKQTTKGPVVILLDEITWMAEGDPDFLGKLKIRWDKFFSKNSGLMLIICGSVSAWIENNILGSTGFLGRPKLHIRLEALPLPVCNQFWNGYHDQVSAYEKLKLLSIMGGVPRYLELLNPRLSSEDNIRLLCFNKNAALFDEFKYIFSDIYGKKSELYQKIVGHLSDGKSTREKLVKTTKIPDSGDLSEYLNNLELGGFISRDYTWDPKTGKIGKLSHYRLKDNYTRFYLKYILPNKERIEKGRFENTPLNSLPGWYATLGLQFENLVINNHDKILKLMGISNDQVVFDNPFFQNKTSRQKGCQIDYLIQTRQDVVYILEIKFSRNELGLEIVDEVKEKINRLKLPKHISRRPILIHVSGVKDSVRDSQYFAQIIDFGELLA